jgi:hypothetical protein
MGKWMITGEEVMERYHITKFELFECVKAGLTGYNDFGLKYIPATKDMFTRNESSSFNRWEYNPPHAPYGYVNIRRTITSVSAMIQSFRDSLIYDKNGIEEPWDAMTANAAPEWFFKPEDVQAAMAERGYREAILEDEHAKQDTMTTSPLITDPTLPALSQASERAAITPLSENPLLSERIVELEGQLAKARQEKEALSAEVVKLRAMVAEIDELAAVDPEGLTDEQAIALKVIVMRHEGKTVKEVGEALFQDAYTLDARNQRVYRAQRWWKGLLTGGDKSAS